LPLFQSLIQMSIWRSLPKDGRLLFASRLARLFAYGFLSVVLVLYLAEVGFNGVQVGLLLTLTLAGDAAITLWITSRADRIGRRRMLLVGAGLMILAAVLFVARRTFPLLLLAATIGVISPSGYEVGPFLSIEQAALAQLVPAERRTAIFAWYNLVGSFATALGALTGGMLAQALQAHGWTHLASYQVVLLGYGLAGLLLLALFSRLSPAMEAPRRQEEKEPGQFARPLLGLTRSRRVVLRLAALFSLDAFAGGLILQSWLAYWLSQRFGTPPGTLGGIFFTANLLAGVSALSAAWVARRIGLINTMVFTHLPSNVLLILVPFMPTLVLSVGVLLLRFSISQMDVPTRQSYLMGLVEPAERSAAAGVTGIARTLGAALGPIFSGLFLSSQIVWGLPFVLAGSLKIVYDVLLYRGFRGMKPPEEQI
jgi:MFS family permease